MVATQLLAYIRNYLYLLHLNLFLYVTPDYHNGEMVRWFNDFFFSPPPSWNLTEYLIFPTTSYTTPVIYFLNLLKNPSLISYSISPNLAFTNVPTIILFPIPRFLTWGWLQVVAAAVVCIEGFMVSSIRRPVLCWA